MLLQKRAVARDIERQERAEIVQQAAQNRTQMLNDVPIAINVISGDELNKVGFSIRLAVKY